MTQFAHKETSTVRQFCSCAKRMTPHSNGVCQWCGRGVVSSEISSLGVVKLDRCGQPITKAGGRRQKADVPDSSLLPSALEPLPSKEAQ